MTSDARRRAPNLSHTQVNDSFTVSVFTFIHLPVEDGFILKDLTLKEERRCSSIKRIDNRYRRRPSDAFLKDLQEVVQDGHCL